MPGKRYYLVLLSSTFQDQRERRARVAKALLGSPFIPYGMEAFPANPGALDDHIKACIEESDYLVLLVGHRYGSVPEGGQWSYTEMEVRHALEHAVPILPFFAEEGNTASGNTDHDKPGDGADSAKIDAARLAAFRRFVKEAVGAPAYFGSDLVLLDHVRQSLGIATTKHPRWGLIRRQPGRALASILSVMVSVFIMYLFPFSIVATLFKAETLAWKETAAGWVFFFGSPLVAFLCGLAHVVAIGGRQGARYHMEMATFVSFATGITGGFACLVIFSGDAEIAFGRLGRDWLRVVILLAAMTGSMLFGAWVGSHEQWGITRLVRRAFGRSRLAG